MSDQGFKNHGACDDRPSTIGEAIAETTNHELDAIGYWGKWDDQLVPEALMAVTGEVIDGYAKTRANQDLLDELDRFQHTHVGRPSPLYYAEKFSADIGADVWLEHEDLNHTGSHKINDVLGQVLSAKRMGKENTITETGADQRGVVTAIVCTLLGLNCRVYMGKVDVIRQYLNVTCMQLLGVEVIEVEISPKTLKDMTSEAMRFWVSYIGDTYHCFDTTVGPHPFSTMMRDFQRVVSAEAHQQILAETGLLPDAVVTCIGGGSNTIGAFHRFIDNESVRLVGAEADGDGAEIGRHAAPISVTGNPGTFQNFFTTLMQNEDGQTTESHSISAGLDYLGMGPEYSYLTDIGRTSYLPVTDTQTMQAFQDLTRMKDILSATESAHAMAVARLISGDPDEELGRKLLIIVNVSSRGDEDVDTAAKWFDLMEES